MRLRGLRAVGVEAEVEVVGVEIGDRHRMEPMGRRRIRALLVEERRL